MLRAASCTKHANTSTCNSHKIWLSLIFPSFIWSSLNIFLISVYLNNKTCLEELLFTQRYRCWLSDDLSHPHGQFAKPIIDTDPCNKSFSSIRHRNDTLNERNLTRKQRSFKTARLLRPPARLISKKNPDPKKWTGQSLRRLFRRSSRSASASARAACGSAFFPPATDRLPPVLGRPETNKNKQTMLLVINWNKGRENLSMILLRRSYSTARRTDWGRARPALGTRWRRCTRNTSQKNVLLKNEWVLIKLSKI